MLLAAFLEDNFLAELAEELLEAAYLFELLAELAEEPKLTAESI